MDIFLLVIVWVDVFDLVKVIVVVESIEEFIFMLGEIVGGFFDG